MHFFELVFGAWLAEIMKASYNLDSVNDDSQLNFFHDIYLLK